MRRFQINLNGNEAKDFVHAAQRLSAALIELREAMAQVQGLCHGRNYQTVESPALASTLDRNDLAAAYRNMNAIEGFSTRFAYEVDYQVS